MQRKIIFITGGARSGKSSFALKEASGINGPKAYIATAEALDDEMKKRIENHRRDRGDDWDTFEEPLKVSDTLSKIDNKYEAIVLDCLTLWLSNIMHQKKNPGFSNLYLEEKIKELVDAIKKSKDPSPVTHHGLRLYIVSNEVGMGIVPDNPLAREFRDLAGSLNQKVAEAADEVFLVTSGIPIKIKG
jgi:adenosylcobinamide kinase/adenosylcobinamide-phosphate guanylyltransferase